MEENRNFSANEAPSARFCSRCGRRLAYDAAYCDGCGHAQSSRHGSGFIPKSYAPEKISDIVGKERAYYNRRFTELRETGSKVCWNWYACLGWYWYAYRKMPIEAAVFFALNLFLGLFGPLTFILRLTLFAASGAFGNYVYLKHIERTIDRIAALPSSLRADSVKEYGGVSGLMLIIAFILSGSVGGGLTLASQTLLNPFSLIDHCLICYSDFK